MIEREKNLGDENSDYVYKETVSMVKHARSVLYMAGFISEVENEHINQRIRKYQERYKADSKMNIEDGTGKD